MIRPSSQLALSEPPPLPPHDAACEGFTTLALRVARWAQSLPSPQRNGLAPGAAEAAVVLGVTSCTSAKAAAATIGQLAAAAAAVFPRGVLIVEGGTSHDRLTPEHIQHTGHSNVWRLRGPSSARGGPPRLPFEADEFWAGLQPLRGPYGLVLVDLPPAGDSEQGRALAAMLDGVLLVVEAERTHARVAQRIKDDLETLGARLLGAVLTGAREQLPAWLDRRLP